MRHLIAVLCVVAAMQGGLARAGFIQSVDVSQLITTQHIGFDPNSITSYNGRLLSFAGASFAERFDGQTITYTGTPSRPFEILSPTVSSPLTLVPGLSPIDMFLSDFGQGPDRVALYGATTNSVGEGSIAVLFDVDQVGFSFEFANTNGGPIYLHFFARDGRLLDSLSMYDPGAPLPNLGFLHKEGKSEIAGFTISNENPGGIGIDNLRFGVVNPVPEPSAFTLLSIGIVTLIAVRLWGSLVPKLARLLFTPVRDTKSTDLITVKSS